jgi:hypothetical protein
VSAGRGHHRAYDAGPGHLRASDADRDQVIDVLKAAFVQGRLNIDELAARAGQVLTSRTYAELAAITADIPARAIAAPAPPQPARAPARKAAPRKAVVLGACAVVLSALMGAAFLTFYGGFVVLLLVAFIGATVTAQP